jgi:hypothetical protein
MNRRDGLIQIVFENDLLPLEFLSMEIDDLENQGIHFQIDQGSYPSPG